MKLRCLCALCAGVLMASSAVAQSPQYVAGTVGSDSVSRTTVVAVQPQPTQIVERTTVVEVSDQGLDRAERRALKAKLYARRVDSLVLSRNYMFFPNSMQECPGGLIRNIFATYYYFGMFVDHVEVHLPTERGLTQYVEILNFDSMSVHNYQASPVQWGWSITFDVTNDDSIYHVDFAVSTATGETVLTLITPVLTMRYLGWLWDKRINDPKFYRQN